MRVPALILALTAFACADRDGEVPAAAVAAVAGPGAPLSVYVVNYPLQYFALRIGGEQVEVTLRDQTLPSRGNCARVAG